MRKGNILTAVAAIFVSMGTTWEATSQSIEQFYQGKNVELLIGFGPGGGNDTWARLVAAHIGNHIPGNPTVIPKNMPGSGGLKVANYLYDAAPKDGRVFGLVNRGIPLEPLLGGKGADFDPRKFNWIGSPDKDTTVCAALKTSEVQNMQDLFTKELVMGATGSGADTAIYPEFLKAVLDMNFRVIKGYKGSTGVALAMERGEVDGVCLASRSLQAKSVYKQGKVNVLFQAALKPNPDLKGVPSALDEVKTDADRQALELFFSRVELGRPFVAPPEVPKDRVEALREAFVAMTRDPEFIADAKKRKFTITLVRGNELQELVENIYETPKPVVERTAAALGRK